MEAWVSARLKKRLPSYASAYRGDSPVRGNVCDSRQKGSRLPEEKRRRALCATEGYFLIFQLCDEVSSEADFCFLLPEEEAVESSGFLSGFLSGLLPDGAVPFCSVPEESGISGG